MNNQTHSASDSFRQIQILHLAICLGPILMTLAFAVVFGIEINTAIEFNAMVLAAAMVLFGAITVSNILKSQNTGSKEKLKRLEEKLNHYRTFSLIQWAMIEGAVLMSIVFYFFIENNIIFLILFLIGITLILLARPTLDNFFQAYNISEQDKTKFK